MTRIVFDIDGTLLRSNELDAELYARAFVDTFGVPLPSVDWSRYRHVTDRGIAEQAVTDLGLDRSRLAEFRANFVNLTTQHSFEQIQGAADLFAELRGQRAHVAIATGGFEATARHKLRTAGIVVDGVPLVGSDHESTREGILRAAIAQLHGAEPVVYIGDAEWDWKTTRTLGIGFVCVTAEEPCRFDAPSIRDFVNREAFMRAVATAASSPAASRFR